MARTPRRATLAVSLVLAVLAAAALAPGARAQALPPMDYSQYDVLLNTLGISDLPARSGGGSSSHAEHTPRRPTSRQRATLRFRATPSVTRALYAEVTATSGLDAATVTAQLDAAKREYRRVLTDVAHWRVQDLGDAAAFALLQAYAKLRDVDHPPRRGLTRLRAAVRDDLALQRSVRRLSDARQQAIAERLELRTIFLISDITGAQMRGDAAAESAARTAMRDWAKDVFGVDVTRVRLTSRGLVRR